MQHGTDTFVTESHLQMGGGFVKREHEGLHDALALDLHAAAPRLHHPPVLLVQFRQKILLELQPCCMRV